MGRVEGFKGIVDSEHAPLLVLSLRAQHFMEKGQIPAVHSSSGAALLPSMVLFCPGLQSCLANSCKNIVKELMKKG